MSDARRTRGLVAFLVIASGCSFLTDFDALQAGTTSGAGGATTSAGGSTSVSTSTMGTGGGSTTSSTGGGGTGGTGGGGPTGPSRGMWVWGSTPITDAGERAALLAFCQAKGIDEIYVESEGVIGSQQAALQVFLQDAADAGVEVELLFGDTAWVTNPGPALALASQAKTFVATLPAAIRPKGLHYDVEPHAIADWDTKIDVYSGQYLDLLDGLRSTLAGSGLRLTVDIGHFYDTTQITYQSQNGSLLSFVLGLVDRAVPLTYRDLASGGNSIIDLVEEDLVIADPTGKKLIIGIETGCSVADNLTFCEEGEAAMETAITTVLSTVSSEPSFRGIAIHSWDSYSTMAP